MSAFVVSDETINRAIWFLGSARELDFIRRQIQECLGVDISTLQGKEQLGQAMFDLNCRAVDERYGENQAREFRDLDYRYRHAIHTSTIQCFKDLQCWLYQCCEGSVPSEYLLYATMDRIKGELAEHIVCNLPSYNSARWDS